MIELQCPKCSRRLRVAEKNAGKRVRCKCQTVLRIPQPAKVIATSTVTAQHAVSGASSAQSDSLDQDRPGPPDDPFADLPSVDAAAPVGDFMAYQPLPAAHVPQANISPGGNPSSQRSREDELLKEVAGGPSAMEGLAARQAGLDPNVQHSASVGTGKLWFVNGATISGMGVMVGAVVWFVAGWLNGVIFFYPPFLFIGGLVQFFRGFNIELD